ncbi:nicotinate-nucleotide adenylyltransferase [Endobacter medicaginis]|uniref:Probable nicotinate-nucleotide adenylyltransferase n=1 Tax=Endobacter medicaginis TaxID=1181271 RepID=A0A850NKP8_9PROT|nr:nicotinate-nucleotide adenylyltransferase [Endobacter medicaginis]
MRVGLLGGSFNPAHEGHIALAKVALHRLGLDEVWLLVSPGNPLKPRRGMATLAERFASCVALIDDARLRPTAIEARLHTRYTIDTLRALRRRFPRVCFVWLMGADSLESFTRWRFWLEITRTVPFAVVPRPGYNRQALASRSALRLRPFRIPLRSAQGLACMAPPAWVFLPAPQKDISATSIRNARRNRRHRQKTTGRQGRTAQAAHDEDPG